MRLFARIPVLALLAAGVVVCCAIIAQSQQQEQTLDTAVLLDAPNVPQMVVDSDGTRHFGPVRLPCPHSPVRKPDKPIPARCCSGRGPRPRAADQLPSGTEESTAAAAPGGSKETALKIYRLVEESQEIGDVGVTVYSPKAIPSKNRNKVLMEFEMDAEAIAVASLGQQKVIKVNCRGGGPSIPGNEDIVAVYRELLKTFQPKNIGMFGTSGGCTLAQTTILQLPQRKLPLPGAVGLGTCSGGSNPGDARYILNGLDAGLSSAFSGQPPFGGRNATPKKPGEPPATALDGEIPQGYPPAFLLSGTRDMCLGQTALVHRKLRRAGGDADLNVFEGMWHFFWERPELPESREAMTELASFFNRHLE